VTEQFLNCAHQPKRGSKRGAAQHSVLQARGLSTDESDLVEHHRSDLTLRRFKSSPLFRLFPVGLFICREKLCTCDSCIIRFGVVRTR
jgi:hypothetical protein